MHDRFAFSAPAEVHPSGHAIIYPAADKIQVQMPSGLNIFVTRIFLDENGPDDRTQLCVSINTEEMGDTDHADDGPGRGKKPLMAVTLNDATLYDEEPA